MQNWIVGKVTKRLSKDLDTEVRIKHVSFAFFNRMNLEGTLVRDRQKDTLLYADQVKVRITDWFFLKDELVLKYVGLEDAYINMYRKDSVWNYQFLIDYFTPAKTTAAPTKSNLKLDLKKLDFKNISFVQNDMWIGSKMMVRLGNLQLDAEAFNLEEKKFHINEIDIDQPAFSNIDFEGFRPYRIKSKRKRNVGEMYFNAGNLQITVDKLTIKNGSFINEKETDRLPYPYFDGLHLRFNKVNGTVTNFAFIKDTISATVNLAGKERSGFELKKLMADFRLTPQIMEFKNLDLVTPRSHLQNYYAMRFTDFNRDFSYYITDVIMDARFFNSEIDSDDLAYFAPAARTWKKRISISGQGRGTVTDLSIKNLFVRAGSNTIISGNLAMVGLPDIEKTNITFTTGSLQTTYRDAILFVPAIARVDNPSLSSLGNIKFKGNFIGTIRKFSTAGNFSTNLGAFTTNVSISIPERGLPAYKGSLQTKQFNIGKFLLVKNMENVTFDGKVDGIGMSLNTLKTSVTGNIHQLYFNNYNYRNIFVEGTFQRKQFDGTVKIDDENLNLYTTVKIDLSGAEPRFNVLGDLANSNFQQLKLINRRLEISGLFDLNFSGRNIDQFLGSVKVYNANLLNDSVRLNFDSLSLQSLYEQGQRSLSLVSNEFNARIVGEYNILDLPNSFQLFLHKYYPAYINEPRMGLKDQRFNFELNTKNIEGYTHLLDKDLAGFSNSKISGVINTVDTVFEMNATVPEVAYKQYRFNTIRFDGKGNLDQLKLNGDIDNILVGDSLSFPNTRIGIVSQTDQSAVSIKAKANNTLNELNLNANVTTYADGVTIKFNPSDFVINDKRWALEKEGEIVIRKRFVSADNVRFTQGDQLIEVKTTYDEDFDKSNLVVNLRNLNIGDFAPFITKNPRLEGLASGEVVLKDFFGRFNIDANLRTDQFRLDNDSIGVIQLNGNYNSTTEKIAYNVESTNELYNFLAEGSYNLNDSLGKPMLNSIRLNNTKIDIVNKFLGNVFSNVTGFASGELQINGNPSSPDLLGRVKISRASLFVKFTQVQYTVDTANFVFTDNALDFGRFTIKDKYGNTGQVTGKIYQRSLQNLRYDFDLSTNRLLLIDTKANDNPQFYGSAIGRATLKLNGPQQNMRMNITAEPVDSSHIYIPTSNSRESGEASFIVFKQYGTELRDDLSAGTTNLTVDLDLKANPLAKIDVILDPLTGDIIKANGNGRLRIHAGTSDQLTIYGRYDILRGSYDFNFQSFIKRPFILREEANSFIEWNGDPFNARLQIEALYEADNVRLGDLIGNDRISIGGAAQGYTGKVYVIANISDYLQKPTIKFRFDFPAGEQIKNDETLNQFLARLERDDNEMLKQVTYVLVFGSFAPYGEGRGIAANLTTFSYNTISELVSKQVNNVVSNILYKITGDRSLQFDVTASVYNSSSLFNGNVTATNTIDRSKVNVKFNKRLLNNKVIVTVGSNFDFGVGSTTATSQQLGNLQWLPDLNVEIILSKDRKLRGIIFSKSNLDIGTSGVGRSTRQGVSISYRREFPTFLGIKKSKSKTKAKEETKVPATLPEQQVISRTPLSAG